MQFACGHIAHKSKVETDYYSDLEAFETALRSRIWGSSLL